ncbi:MAG: aquaporin [Cytophagales bacterium]|nr:aquaporin [Cytophagales bacterium]
MLPISVIMMDVHLAFENHRDQMQRTFTWSYFRLQLRQNYRFYLMEAFGLFLFMVSACLCWTFLASPQSALSSMLPALWQKLTVMGGCMGLTALFIFYSPWTSPSGAHINPAVTLAFYRINRICPINTVMYIIFQFAGGLLGVYLMEAVLGDMLRNAPVDFVVTVPGKYGISGAVLTEFLIAAVMMLMVLFTSNHPKLKCYTRYWAACLVCLYVIFSGPVSGFGMNPARTFASAFPAQIWTAFWVYMLMPVLGMLLASEIYFRINKKSVYGS